MRLSFIPVTDENIETVSKLHVAPSQIGSVETVAESYREAKALPLWRPVAVLIDGDMVGFAMYGLCQHEGERGRVWLDRFFIDERFQGRGYARPVLKELLRVIRETYGYDEIFLSVYADNAVAIRLYESIGFQFNGELDINDERVMVLYV